MLARGSTTPRWVKSKAVPLYGMSDEILDGLNRAVAETPPNGPRSVVISLAKTLDILKPGEGARLAELGSPLRAMTLLAQNIHKAVVASQAANVNLRSSLSAIGAAGVDVTGSGSPRVIAPQAEKSGKHLARYAELTESNPRAAGEYYNEHAAELLDEMAAARKERIANL